MVACCQNIESLVSGQARDKHALLKQELDILSTCDLVISISREDASLLKNFGIDSVFFPYYPKYGDQLELKQIRDERKNIKTKANYLLIGNALNPANGRAMQILTQYWDRENLGDNNNKLFVGGYNSQSLQKFTRHNNKIKFLGELTEENYKKHMSEVKAIIIYQENSTGILTRVIDSLISGVPVVANSCSARTLYHCPGLLEYSELSYLTTVLAKLDGFDGNIPVPQKPNSSQLVAKIAQIAG